jgi:hypothetical protein
VARYRIEFKGNRPIQHVNADAVQDGGKEGRWMDFYRDPIFGARRLVLRLSAEDVTRVERVASQPPAVEGED